MARLILWITLGFLAWLAVRRIKRFLKPCPCPSSSPPKPRGTVQCRQCGVYLDKSLAHRDGPGYRCREHDQNTG